MGAIDRFLQRFGFVRLDRFGLVHTPDGRIMSTRPTVLDDGLGGKIVGWLESDLAAMELETWSAMGQAPKPATAKPLPRPALPKAAAVIAPAAPAPIVAPAPEPIVAAAPVAAPAPVARPLPGVAPMSAAPVAVAPVVAPAPAPAPKPVEVAPAPPVEEDEWEWEIAVARARAEAEPVPAPAAPPSRAVPQWAISDTKTVTKVESWDDTVAEPVRPAAQPFTTKPAPAPAAVARFVAAATTPGTVIPVPQLPVAADARQVRPLPRRMPKATGRLEETIRTRSVPPANEDTQTELTLPPAATTVGLPSSKRVAAKHR